MRRGILSAALLLSVFAGTAEAAPCKPNEIVTLEGEIIIPPVLDGGEWFWPGKFAQAPCQVTTLRGKGTLPGECVVGKRMALTGKVRADGILTLEVSSIRCF